MTSTAFQHGLPDLSWLCQLSYNIYVLLACIPQGQLYGSRYVVPPRVILGNTGPSGNPPGKSSGEPDAGHMASGEPAARTHIEILSVPHLLCAWLVKELGHRVNRHDLPPIGKAPDGKMAEWYAAGGDVQSQSDALGLGVEPFGPDAPVDHGDAA